MPKKKSMKFAWILWMIHERGGKRALSVPEILWVEKQQNKLSEAELVRSWSTFEKMGADENFLKRVRGTYKRFRLRALPLVVEVPEKVRIGKGYTDKGSLRPETQKRSYGMEDIKVLPKWLPKQARQSYLDTTKYGSTAEWVKGQLLPSEARSLAWYVWTRSRPPGVISMAQDFEKLWVQAYDHILTTKEHAPDGDRVRQHRQEAEVDEAPGSDQ